jgi:hypothetical protein
MPDYSRHSGPIRRYLRKELLHFADGTVAEHTSKEVERLAFPEHEPPIVSNFGVWVVPASGYYLQSWKDINPAIRNVTFLYKGL